MSTASLKILQGKKADLASAALNEGSLYFTQDSDELFADYKNAEGTVVRHQLSGSKDDLVQLEGTGVIELSDLLKETYVSADGKYTIEIDGETESPLEYATKGYVDTISADKVDKVVGKTLSSNDFTDTDKAKLNSITAGAEANVQVDWNDENVNSDAYIKHKPTSMPASDVSAWAKADTKPTYTAAEVGAVPLGADGLIASSYLPSYVDDVLEAADKNSFPAAGETGKIYVALDTNLTYRWSGSAYVEISPSLALGETSGTAYAGDKGAAAYAHAVTNKGAEYELGLYKIKTNAEGHVSNATAVNKSDIVALGIPGENTTYAAATDSAAGLMSAADKIKLDGIAEHATATAAYTLPTAAADVLGGVKVGSGLKIEEGVLSNDYSYTLPNASASSLGGVKVGTNLSIAEDGTLSATDTTYSAATTTAAGLMSAADKVKVDGLDAGGTIRKFTLTIPAGYSGTVNGEGVTGRFTIAPLVMKNAGSDADYAKITAVSADSATSTVTVTLSSAVAADLTLAIIDLG